LDRHLKNYCISRGGPPVACAAVAHPSWSSRTALRARLAEFAAVFARHPLIKVSNDGGMGVNHGFALWCTLKALQPQVVIESGVHRGFSTWLVRQALPHARIYSLDPAAANIVASGYRDPYAVYLVDGAFTDFGLVDWVRLIPSAEERASSVVIFDDHMSAVRRVAQAIHLGFRHVWYDDNWARSPKADCYSFNIICADPMHTSHGKVATSNRLNYRDVFSRVNVRISLEEHQANLRFLLAHIDEYVEFPPVLDGCGQTLEQSRVAITHKSEVTRLFGSWVPRRQLHHGHVVALVDLKNTSLDLLRTLNASAMLSYYPPYVRLKPRLNASLLMATTAYRLEHRNKTCGIASWGLPM